MQARIVVVLIALLLGIGTSTARASTAAFGGKVVKVEHCPSNHKDCLVRFTVRIDHFDYISWGKFGRHSKVGETITRQVKKVGTVCMIDGNLVNAKAFAAAIKPGMWGYFYEDTWLDLRTTPNFQWGQVVAHDAAKKQFKLRVHDTHKEYHLETNPPRDIAVGYDGKTAFRTEDARSNAAEALKVGQWVQVRNPRTQMIHVWSEASAYDPREWLPHAEGKRGFANDLTAPAVIRRWETKTPTGVIDQSVKLDVQRRLGGPSGELEDATIDARKVSFILDGKLAPINIAISPRRQVVLGHYRRETRPHKVFVRSRDDRTTGVIESVDSDSITLRIATGRGGATESRKIEIDPEAPVRLDGQATTLQAALKAGRQVDVYPQIGRTIVAFKPQTQAN